MYITVLRAAGAGIDAVDSEVLASLATASPRAMLEAVKTGSELLLGCGEERNSSSGSDRDAGVGGDAGNGGEEGSSSGSGLGTAWGLYAGVVRAPHMSEEEFQVMLVMFGGVGVVWFPGSCMFFNLLTQTPVLP